MLPRNLSAAAQSLSSNPKLAPVEFFPAAMIITPLKYLRIPAKPSH